MGEAGTNESGEYNPCTLPQPVKGQAQLQVVGKEFIADVAVRIIGIYAVVIGRVLSAQEAEFPVNPQEGIFFVIEMPPEYEVESKSI